MYNIHATIFAVYNVSTVSSGSRDNMSYTYDITQSHNYPILNNWEDLDSIYRVGYFR